MVSLKEIESRQSQGEIEDECVLVGLSCAWCVSCPVLSCEPDGALDACDDQVLCL